MSLIISKTSASGTIWSGVMERSQILECFFSVYLHHKCIQDILSSHYLASVAAQHGFCITCTWLKSMKNFRYETDIHVLV